MGKRELTEIFGVLAILAAVGGITEPANAFTLTSFTDRESWESAVQGGFIRENFNSYNKEDESFNGIDLDVGNFTLNGTGSRQKIDVYPFDVPLFDVDRTSMILGQTDSSSFFTITFDFPITAFGANFSDISSQGETQITADSTSVFMTSDDNSRRKKISQNTQFFGFIADQEFNKLTLDSANDNFDGFGMDNFAYVPMNSSPTRNFSINPKNNQFKPKDFSPEEFSPTQSILLTSNNIRNIPFKFSPALGLLSLGGTWLVSCLVKRVKKK